MRDWFREVETFADIYYVSRFNTFKTTIFDEIYGHNKYQIYNIKFTTMGEWRW